MRIRRYLSVLAAAIIFAAFLAPSAALAASGGACISNSNAPYQAGLKSDPSTGIRSVSAIIDPYAGHFNNCGQFSDGWSFSSAWIAIQSPNTGIGNGALVQLGVVECDPDAGGPSWCTNGSDLRYMVAYRGCGWGETRIDLGAVPDWAGHEFEINVDVFRTPYHVGFFIDGLQRYSVPVQDPEVWCWIQANNNNATWFAERGNKGDALGLSSTNPLKFGTVRFGYGLTPNNIPLETGCSTAQPDSGTGRAWCTYSNGSGLMKVWTTY